MAETQTQAKTPEPTQSGVENNTVDQTENTESTESMETTPSDQISEDALSLQELTKKYTDPESMPVHELMKTLIATAKKLQSESKMRTDAEQKTFELENKLKEGTVNETSNAIDALQDFFVSHPDGQHLAMDHGITKDELESYKAGLLDTDEKQQKTFTKLVSALSVHGNNYAELAAKNEKKYREEIGKLSNKHQIATRNANASLFNEMKNIANSNFDTHIPQKTQPILIPATELSNRISFHSSRYSPYSMTRAANNLQNDIISNNNQATTTTTTNTAQRRAVGMKTAVPKWYEIDDDQAAAAFNQ